MMVLFSPPFDPSSSTTKISKRTTSQSIRDHEKVRLRIERAGSNLEKVISYLESIFGPHVTAYSLLKQAHLLSERLNLTIDRLAFRNRQALFCWFTENWDIIYNYLPSIADSQRVQLIQPIMQQVITRQSNSDIDISDISMLLNYH